MTANNVMLPCPNCGAELFGAEDTRTEVEEYSGFEFQGQPDVRELPAKKCPECGEITAL